MPARDQLSTLTGGGPRQGKVSGHACAGRKELESAASKGSGSLNPKPIGTLNLRLEVLALNKDPSAYEGGF